MKKRPQTLDEALLIMEQQQAQIDFLMKKLFGRSSEKKVIDPNQTSLFNQSAPRPLAPLRQESTTKPSRTPKAKREAVLDAKLPVEKEVYDYADGVKCKTCQHEMTPTGERYVREQVTLTEPKIIRRKVYQQTYKCVHCTATAEKPGAFYTSTPVPTPPIAHRLASPSIIAAVIHQKYELQVPLARQLKDWEQRGFKLSTATASNWIIRVAEDWLAPLVATMHQDLMAQSHLHGDETPYQVLNEPNKSNTSRSYLWLICSTFNAKHPIVYFGYEPHRDGAAANRLYTNFNGTLLCDGYADYNMLSPTITRTGCWAHVRRKFVDAAPVSTTKGQDNYAIDLINRLFKLEKQFKDLPGKRRLKRRQLESKPLVDNFFQWMSELTYLPSSSLGKMIDYAAKQQPYLVQFLNYPEIALSNNIAERHIKTAVIGRKNYLFSSSPKGARANTVMLSLIESAKANGLNPQRYIAYLLEEINQ